MEFKRPEKAINEGHTGGKPGFDAFQMLHTGFSFIGIDGVKRLL